MGWYDAFKGDVARVDTSKATTSGGAMASAFGDAFTKIGTSVIDKELTDSKLLAQEKQNKLNDATYAKVTQDTQQGKKTFDDAFNTKKEVEAQELFNDEALSVSATGNYKNMEEFTKANPQLVINADGATMQKVNKYYQDLDKTAINLDMKTRDMNHATQINNLSKQLAKSQANKGFVYGQDTDSKIATIVGKSMGLESDMNTWDTDQKAEFNKKTTGIATISQKYNLTPLLSMKLYEEQELKNAQLAEEKAKEKKAQEEAKKPRWKDLKID